MTERRETGIGWIDLLFLAFLAGLALLAPVNEIHKQLILAAIGMAQLLEGRLVRWSPNRGPAYSVLIKIALSTLLLGHTSELGINSSYYPIFYLPVITAAIYFGPLETLLWTALASLAYCSYLYPALQEYRLTETGIAQLGIRIMFFFFAAVLVNRFASENRRRVQQYQAVSTSLAESNRQLQLAQAEARRAERLAALGQLSAGLAHEIRNPLGVIKGSAEMLNQKLQAAQPVVGELAGYISSEVNRLNSLVARFLDFARPSQLDLRPLDVSALIERALATVQAQQAAANGAGLARITIERAYAEDLPQVVADEQLCEQVFVNLILNAYQAMNGSGTLRVAIRPDSVQQPSGVAIEIEDSGPGVPEELREQIFNPFFTSKPNGVGLGLSIVAKIVDDHRGTIQLSTGAGGGACFRVFLPAAQAAVAAELPRES